MEEKEVPVKDKKHGKSLLSRMLKALLWTVTGIIIFIALLLGTIALILTPEKLTPIAERYANEYLDADVNIGKVELTVWKTFPRLRIDVDSVSIVSKSLSSANPIIRQQLPSNADTLLTLGHFHGGINISPLLSGKVELYDIVLQQPMINLVSANDSIANYNIVPLSNSPEEPDTTATTIPEITIDRFTIADALPIEYFSLSDSIDAGIRLGTTYIDGNEAPQYELAINGDIKALLPPLISENDMPIGLNGKISWNHENPYIVKLEDFDIDIAEIHGKIDTSIDCGDSIIINTLNLNIAQTPINALLSHIPKQYSGGSDKEIKTDLTIGADIKLLSPYNLSDSTSIPSVDIAIEIPKGRLSYKERYRLKEFATSVKLHVDGKKPNSSTATIKSLSIDGMGVTASLNGTLKTLMSDPQIDGEFTGSIDFDRLPPFVKDSIPAIITGKLSADTKVRFKKSDLSGTRFHRAQLSGSATLHDFSFDIPDSATSFYTHETTFRFGTNNSFVTDSNRVDSLLTASVRIDSALVQYDGMRLMLKNAKAGVGCKNIASSTDSTQINPIGATIKAERVNFRSTDSSRIRLRNIVCKASLRRFNKKAKVPELNLQIEARRISYGDKLNRLSLRESNLNITAHIRERQRMGKRMQAKYDSIAQLHPNLPPDSIYKLIRPLRKRKAQTAKSNSDSEIVDFDLDNSMKQLLRRWNVHGTITAKRGRLFTPYFPLRNTLSNINFDFTTDSITLRRIKYDVGQSDFTISGKIRNIRRALTSRRGSPLEIAFAVSSDTININEIAQTAFAGAAFSEKDGEGISIGNIEDEDSIQLAIEQHTDTSESAALLIPKNINASISLRAKNVYYADLLLNRFRGNMYIMNGALNLNNLSAKTDMGDIRMSALYTAPTKKDLKFGFGLQIKDLQVDKVINLIPAVDSLMPLLKDIEGVIDADIAATTDVDSTMNLVIPTLNAAIKIHGDSLVLLDAETFRTLSKWLMFKNKKRNMIDQMTVEILVENSTLELFPFMFDIDRYRLGIMGQNDLALNLNYHISVLKSPLPFKFGINITGNADDMKIRVGKARYNEKSSGQKIAIVDTTRINLMNEIENVFRRGVNVAKLGKLNVNRRAYTGYNTDINSDTITHADSLMLIKEGILPSPPEDTISTERSGDNTGKKKRRRK